MGKSALRTIGTVLIILLVIFLIGELISYRTIKKGEQMCSDLRTGMTLKQVEATAGSHGGRLVIFGNTEARVKLSGCGCWMHTTSGKVTQLQPFICTD